MEYKGIAWLQSRLAAKKTRVNLRYKYYEQKHTARDFGIMTPDNLKLFGIVNGWCTKAVDSLADRIQFHEWRNDNFDFAGLFDMNNPDTLYDSAILSAMVASCSFVMVSPGEDVPRLQVIDGSRATGIIDDFTGMLTEAYAELEYDTNHVVTKYAYFTLEQTEYYSKVNGKLEMTDVVSNPAPYCLLVPVIYRPDAVRPFGHSRISRACMGIADSAMRTLKRAEISAEYYSMPQKYATGVSQDAAPLDKWKASASSMLTFSKDDDGDSPTLGMFTGQSPQPFTEQLRMLAASFAGETGLTLDDLGFVSENPTSAEAIKASHENLRLYARKAQRNFNSSFLNVGYIGTCLRDNREYERSVFRATHIGWEPVFEPDAAQLSSIGDGIIKIQQSAPEYLTDEKLYDLIGV